MILASTKKNKINTRAQGKNADGRHETPAFCSRALLFFFAPRNIRKLSQCQLPNFLLSFRMKITPIDTTVSRRLGSDTEAVSGRRFAEAPDETEAPADSVSSSDSDEPLCPCDSLQPQEELVLTPSSSSSSRRTQTNRDAVAGGRAYTSPSIDGGSSQG